MLPLPELHSWRQGVIAEEAEKRVRWLRESIRNADEAIEVQQRIISPDESIEGHPLSVEGLRRSQQRMEAELADLMRYREIEVIDFALAGGRYDGHRAGAKTLSVFLDVLQKLFERVGQAINDPNPGPVIRSEIRQLCQLEVAGFFPSSFGVRFAAMTRTDLTGSSLANSALEATFELVNSSSPVEQAARVGQRAMMQYRHLVTTLIKAEATPKVSWRSPSGEELSWINDDNALLTLANRLSHIRDMKPKVVVAQGVLTGASLSRQKFEFSGDEGRVTGKAPRDLSAKVKEYFGKTCQITYIETLFIDETTEQEKKSRVLVDITHA